jgi:hypothetical protein
MDTQRTDSVTSNGKVIMQIAVNKRVHMSKYVNEQDLYLKDSEHVNMCKCVLLSQYVPDASPATFRMPSACAPDLWCSRDGQRPTQLFAS